MYVENREDDVVGVVLVYVDMREDDVVGATLVYVEIREDDEVGIGREDVDTLGVELREEGLKRY